MYVTYKDIIWNLNNRIAELVKLQEKILSEHNDLDKEATEEDKERYFD